MIITHNGTILTNDGVVLNNITTSPSFQNTYSTSFDGIDDRVQLTSDFVASGEFTISFWMKPTSISGNGNAFVMGTFPGNDNYIKNDQLSRIYLRINATTLSFFETYLGSPENFLVLNVWQNITFIRDSLNVIRCYRNGTSFGNPSALPTNSNTLTLNSFGRIITNTFGFNGGLDEIAFWNTDETANVTEIGGTVPTDLTDLSPYLWLRMGDNGSYKSPQWLIPSNENKDKVSNYSTQFDGNDDIVTIGAQSLGITGAISISAWVKIPTTNTGGGGTNIQVIAAEDAAGGTGRNWTMYWRGGGQDYFNFAVWHTDGSSTSITSTGIVPNDGEWHHLLGTYDGTTSVNGLKLFVDGNAFQTTAGSSGVRSSPTVNPAIGALSAANGWFFEGNIDEVSIWDNVVSIGNVWDGSGKPIDITPTNPFAYWKMGENATFVYNVNPDGTWIIPDEVGSNDGTSNNLMADSARVGSAPSSSNNAVSFNMDLIDRVPDTPPTP